MRQGLRALWASTGFRLAASVGLLVGITMLAVLAVVYLQTVGVMQQRMARAVTLDAQRLMLRYEQGGLEGLAAAIEASEAGRLQGDDELRLLLGPEGQRLAGNMELPPSDLPMAGAVVQRVVWRQGRAVTAYLQQRHLPGGGTLLVGRDMRDQETVEGLVIQASLAAMIVSALLLVGGTFVFRQGLDRAVAGIRQTAERIAGGQLQARVATSDEPDEFALLSRDINHMLDRIQSLMDGVRHVSDTIAHNLRTPLTRALLRIQRGLDHPGDAATLQAVLQDSAADLHELAATFEKLLAIAEAEAGTRRMPFAAVDLQAIALDVCEMYEPLAHDAGQRLEHAPGPPAWVQGDRDLLASAVANLVDNALKHGGAGTRVRVQAGRSGAQVWVSAQDSGPGVPQQELQRLGVRFHRLNPEVPGQGLGLASVRAIAALHGGALRLEAADPGLRAVIALPTQPGG